MAVLGTGSWTLTSGPRVKIAHKIKDSICRVTLASGSYQNGIKLPPIGFFGFKRNIEIVEVVAAATGMTQGVLWTFDRVNRKLRARGMGSASLVSQAGGLKRFAELTSKSFGASVSQFRARTMHIHSTGW